MHFGPLYRHWRLILTKYVLRAPRRYREILECIRTRHAISILEIGVYTGGRAAEMINAASISHRPAEIRYVGFDLFEKLTPELCRQEYSKTPAPEADIKNHLTKTGAQIQLFAGFSQETLPRYIEKYPEPIDLIFIDGGHAEGTIRSDWENVKNLMGPHTVVFFDDYYHNADEEVPGIGCQNLIDTLDRTMYDVRVCSMIDRFPQAWGMLKISLARVSLRPRPLHEDRPPRP